MLELPRLVVQVVKTLKETYDHRGSKALDEDAAKLFHAIGWIIAKLCRREHLPK